MAEQRHPSGRPSVVTESVIVKLETAFAIGANVTEACLVARISRDAYYRFVKNHPHYADRFAELQQRPVIAAKKRVVDAITAENDTGTAKWYLERRCREDYSLHQKLDMTVENCSRLDEQEVTERLTRLLEKIQGRQQANPEVEGNWGQDLNRA